MHEPQARLLGAKETRGHKNRESLSPPVHGTRVTSAQESAGRQLEHLEGLPDLANKNTEHPVKF